MEQAITDYVKFLADARDAVYRLNNDQATANAVKTNRESARKKSWQLRKGSDRFGEPDHKKCGAARSIQAMTKRSQKVRNG